MKRANEWTRDKLADVGPGRTPTSSRGARSAGAGRSSGSRPRSIEPQCIPLIAYPKAWSPGTDGTLVGAGRLLRRQDRGRLRQVQGQAQGRDRPDRPRLATSRPTSSRWRRGRPTRSCSSWPTPPSPPPAASAAARRQGQPASPAGQAEARPAAAGTGQPRPRPPPAAAGRRPRGRFQMTPERRAQMQLAAQEAQVPRRRGRRGAGRSQHAGRRRHALRRPGHRARRAAASPTPGPGAGRPAGSRPGTRTRPRSCRRSSSPRSTTTAWSG